MSLEAIKSDFVARQVKDLLFYTIPRFEREGGVSAAFSSRQGGRSRGAYATLNLGLHVGDDPETVLANRALFCAALGLDHRRLVSCVQVHGTKVEVVGAADRGRGADDPFLAVPDADGLATAVPGVPLITFYGDCVPLFFYDPIKRVVGLAHAGWRGTLGRIGARMLSVLEARFGTSPARVLTAIGPAIGPCCYLVGSDVADQFVREFGRGPTDAFVRQDPDGNRRLDLWAINRQILLAAGVPAANIFLARRCTACAPGEFFSHRADRGQTGRMAAVIALK